MRVQRRGYGLNAIGKCGTMIRHNNNTLHILLDNGIECDDLYWNWIALDTDAKTYLLEVEKTATPMLTPVNDD